MAQKQYQKANQATDKDMCDHNKIRDIQQKHQDLKDGLHVKSFKLGAAGFLSTIMRGLATKQSQGITGAVGALGRLFACGFANSLFL